MDFLISTFKGMIIGIGAVLPGISSGVICVILGIYDKLVKCSLELFTDFKNNFKFLFPIALGGIIGFILFGKVLNYLFSIYDSECKAIFFRFYIR